MVNIKLPFGLNVNNVLVHIADVESGLKCGCVCPGCRSPLIAAKGYKNQHHFKHATGSECENGLESAIHLAAKKIITERKQITLSEYVAIASEMDSKEIIHTEREAVVQNGKVLAFESVQEEVELPGMKADLLAKLEDKPFIIEIFYRHKVEEPKSKKIAESKISAIEIDLSDLTPRDVINWDAFWSHINNPERVKWLYNSEDHDSVSPRLKDKLVKKITELEAQYEKERSERQRLENEEKEHLLRALDKLKIARSSETISQLKQNAETHPVWIHFSQYLKYPWNELPHFLNADVPDGDWIFGCDRRVWQTALYSSFFDGNDNPHFQARSAYEWLVKNAGCEVPTFCGVIGKYHRRFPHIVPSDVLLNLPSVRRTLDAYLNLLCKLGTLRRQRHNNEIWFEITAN